jgi:hypothetical protein
MMFPAPPDKLFLSLPRMDGATRKTWKSRDFGCGRFGAGG